MTAKKGGVLLFQWLFTIGAILVALWPVWLFLLAKHMLAPEGFWQKFVVLGAGVWCLGFIQVVMVVLLFVFLAAIWDW